MLKTHIEKAKVYVTARFKNEGSVLRETMQAEAHARRYRFETTEKVAKVIRNAEAGCYVIQTIRRPTEVKSSYALNGRTFDPAAYQKTGE